jgi:hypothetical protein
MFFFHVLHTHPSSGLAPPCPPSSCHPCLASNMLTESPGGVLFVLPLVRVLDDLGSAYLHRQQGLGLEGQKGTGRFDGTNGMPR